MVTAEIVLSETTQLSGQLAGRVVSLATEFSSYIQISNVSAQIAAVDAKSLVKLIKLAGGPGDHLVITADGPDERAALHALRELMQRNDSS